MNISAMKDIILQSVTGLDITCVAYVAHSQDKPVLVVGIPDGVDASEIKSIISSRLLKTFCGQERFNIQVMWDIQVLTYPTIIVRKGVWVYNI